MTKIQNLYILLKIKHFNSGFAHWVLVFGAYLLFGYCDLEFKYHHFVRLPQTPIVSRIPKNCSKLFQNCRLRSRARRRFGLKA